MAGASVALEVVRYRPADRGDVFAFLDAVAPASHRDRLAAQWDWKYDANPLNDAGGPYLLLLRDGARILGMIGDVPARVAIAGRPHRVTCTCDLFVHPDHRRHGLSRVMIEQNVADHPLTFAWVNPVSARATARSTSRSVRIHPLVKPLDAGAVLRALGLLTWGAPGAPQAPHVARCRSGRPGAAGAPLDHSVPAQPLSTWVTPGSWAASRFRRRPARPGAIVVEVDRVDERFDALWQRVARRTPVLVVRDQAYLDWRFFRRPDADYTMLAAVEDGDLLGYVVLRVVERQGLRWGYLVDFLVPDDMLDVWTLLVEASLERFRADRVAIVRCLAHAPRHLRALYRLGFFPWRRGESGFFFLRVNRPAPEWQMFGDFRRWFATMGDGDLEMSM